MHSVSVYLRVRSLAVGMCALALLAVAGGRAEAAPPAHIGNFNFAVDQYFGPVFSVENYSDRAVETPSGSVVDRLGEFTNVTVHLFSGADPNPVYMLPLTFANDPTIAPANNQSGFRQTTADLSGITFNRAKLVLSFSRSGDVVVDELTNLSFSTDPATGLFVPVLDFPSKLIDHAVPNVVPTANAGQDRSIRIGNTIQVDGSGSADSDSGPQALQYAWTIVSKPAGSAVTNASIANAGAAQASLVPDVYGVYELALTVNDGAATSSDTVSVAVNATQTATGSAFYMHSGFQEKLDVSVTANNGVATAGSSLKYYYVRTRTDLQSTAITSITVQGNTATIAGNATMNGAAGYKFVAVVTGAATDAFGITITKPDGSQFYQNPSTPTAGGDLVVTVQ
jgi:uncharacterized Zn-binding protein involved in type VI secretion